MPDFPSPFGGSRTPTFDDEDAFVAEHVPDPGPFLEAHDVLTGDDHVAVHQVVRELFEERGVYDATFGYNLARLNLDTRHPNAGYRYAEEADDPAVLRAEFTPTTKFCPQTASLTAGSFRALNAEPERHGYDLVRIRASPMHQRAESVNERLTTMEAEVRESGLDDVPEEPPDLGSDVANGAGLGGEELSRSNDSTDGTPF